MILCYQAKYLTDKSQRAINTLYNKIDKGQFAQGITGTDAEALKRALNNKDINNGTTLTSNADKNKNFEEAINKIATEKGYSFDTAEYNSLKNYAGGS